MSKIFEKIYEVEYRDTNPRRTCKFSSYMEFMSDIAFKHDASLGLSISDLLESNHTWVVFDYKIKTFKETNYQDELRVTTYIKTFKKYFAVRVFEIYNNKNELVLQSESLAFFIDMIKVKPSTIPDYYYDKYQISEEDKNIKIEKLKLKKPERIDIEKKFEVRYTDIDFNYHVGNVNYVKWIINSMPIEVIRDYAVSEFNIKYEKQIKNEDCITVQTQIEHEQDKIYARHIILDSNNNEMALLESYWRKNYLLK
jgi:YbgC/YbaW family acyl-CoA thioester hydrolase